MAGRGSSCRGDTKYLLCPRRIFYFVIFLPVRLGFRVARMESSLCRKDLPASAGRIRGVVFRARAVDQLCMYVGAVAYIGV